MLGTSRALLVGALLMVLPTAVTPPVHAVPHLSGTQTLAAPPRSQITATTTHWLSQRAQVTWTGVAGKAKYDVRVSRTDARSKQPAAWRQPRALTGLTRLETNATISPGTAVCFAVRVRAAGVTGPWSNRSCVIRAFAVSQLQRSGNVSPVTDPEMWGHRALVTLDDGRVTLSDIPRRANIGAVVTHPSDTGSFRLRAGSTTVALGFSMPEDELDRNVSILVPGRTSKTLKLAFTSGSAGVPSFPLQALYVVPPWLATRGH